MDCFLHGKRDLLREPLLDLQPATEGLGYPSKFREPENELVGNVGDRNLHIVRRLLQVRDRALEGSRERAYLAGEWDEMVFAKAGDLDVPDEDHLVVILLEDGVVDDVWAEGQGSGHVGRGA